MMDRFIQSNKKAPERGRFSCSKSIRNGGVWYIQYKHTVL